MSSILETLRRRQTTSRGPVDELRDLPLLASCTTRELRRVDRLLTQLRIRGGRTLLRSGATELVLVTDGAVGVRDGDDLTVLGRGAAVGQDGGTSDPVRSVVSLSDVTMLVAGPAEVAALRAMPSVAHPLAEAFERAHGHRVPAPIVGLSPREQRTGRDVAILVYSGLAA